MLLKKHHQIPAGWEPQRDAHGTLLNEPLIARLRLIHTGTHPEQSFSGDFVNQCVVAGLCTLAKGQLTLSTEQEDLIYTILHLPGTYLCCHCGALLANGDPTGRPQREHCEARHPGLPSPDPQHPSGYRRVMAYECVLDAAQHARWQRPAGATVSHYRREE